MGRLRELLSENTPDMAAVTSHLDSLDSTARVAEVRTLGRRQQARLFEAAKGYKPVTLNDIVSSDRGAMHEVVHHGKNSLPLFNRFAKVFMRPTAGSGPELWGYNRTGTFIETVVGPGYFVAYPFEVDGEVLVDYLRVPPERPEHWPAILPNSARLSRFVYNGTQDILRGVSEHVTIGRAMKGGKPMSAWFVLCRDDES
ncbi:MAG: hypothetical protein JSU89_16560 [Myxococcales bacterium]|nr:MAG: hypothetical protein JSU89_16560 [Myxococcales bacterium]